MPEETCSLPYEDVTFELIYPKSKAARKQRSSRTETYEELRNDMLDVYGPDIWSIMAEYIHGYGEFFKPTQTIQTYGMEF